jgi:hypothetical protein
LIKFAGAIVWLLYLVDRFGRKPLLIVGAAGGAVSMYYIGAYIAIAKPENNAPGTKLGSGGISAIAFFYIWTCFYGPTWNGTPWVFGAEVMPTFVRAATQSIIAASNWLFAFAIARATPYMFEDMKYGVYLFFASFMVVSIPIVYFIVPETAHIRLEEMSDLFALPPRKAHGIIMSRNRENANDRHATAITSESFNEGDDEKGVESRNEYV